MGMQTELLPGIVDQLVGDFHPLQIVLFGSVARGTEGPDSDIDLLVVMPEGTDRRQAAISMRRALANLPAAKDIVVVTPSIVETYRDFVGHIVRPALSEGEILYDAARAS